VTAGRTIRVVLADDHEVVRAGLRLLIDGQDDMEVVGEAATGEETLHSVRALHPNVAVVDLTMPGIGGLAAIRALRREGGSTKVVVLTRHEDDAYVRELMSAGTTAYILKHSGSAQLLNAIRAAARNERYLDPALPRASSSRRAKPERGPRVTKRECDVLRLTAVGYSNKEIAVHLGISVRTVEVHKTNGMRKLSLAGRADVVRYAALQGWLKDP
jgi:two-component system, NarL family, response regulator NreC